MVQTAVKIVIEPVLEADLSPYTFGYRPQKSALDAIKIVQGMLNQGYTDVVDADLSKYFDTIPHSELLKSIAARISDRHILRLIKMWLKAPVEERDENGGKRMTGGKTAKKGTPQGGVISPLLANRYMNRFLKYWTKTEQPRRLRAQIVSYADDFVILSRGRAAEAPDWTRNAITRLGLTLNEAKTRLKDAHHGPDAAGGGVLHRRPKAGPDRAQRRDAHRPAYSWHRASRKSGKAGPMSTSGFGRI